MQITVPAPEAVQQEGGESAETGSLASLDGTQVGGLNSNDTDASRNDSPRMDGEAGGLHSHWINSATDLVTRIKRLPRMLVWGSIAGALILLVLVSVALRRPAVERQYIDQLLRARESAELALKHWENIQVLREFPIGPHFRDMSADSALAEVSILKPSINRFPETMRDLVIQTNAMGATGTQLVARRPELKDKVDAVGFHGDMDLSFGNPSVSPRLQYFMYSIDQALDALHVKHPK